MGIKKNMGNSGYKKLHVWRVVGVETNNPIYFREQRHWFHNSLNQFAK